MNIKRAIGVVILFLGALFISLLINTPINQLFRFIELPQDIQLQGVTGTISSGHIENLHYQGFSVSGIDFKIRSSCIINATICYQFESNDYELYINIEKRVLSSEYLLTRSTFQLDSDLFSRFSQWLIRPKGRININVEKLSFLESKLSGLNAEVDWVDAGIEGEEQVLGDYHALITTDTDKIRVQLSDSEGLLSVQGGVDINRNGQYLVDIQLNSQPSLNPSVKSALDIMAKKTGLNQYAIKRTDTLPAKFQGYLAAAL